MRDRIEAGIDLFLSNWIIEVQAHPDDCSTCGEAGDTRSATPADR